MYSRADLVRACNVDACFPPYCGGHLCHGERFVFGSTLWCICLRVGHGCTGLINVTVRRLCDLAPHCRVGLSVTQTTLVSVYAVFRHMRCALWCLRCGSSVSLCGTRSKCFIHFPCLRCLLPSHFCGLFRFGELVGITSRGAYVCVDHGGAVSITVTDWRSCAI